jgi:hypothetical protein
LTKKTRLTLKARKTTAIARRGGGDHAAGAADPDGDRLLVAVAEVVAFLDPCHHQHRVVGGEAEDDAKRKTRLVTSIAVGPV